MPRLLRVRMLDRSIFIMPNMFWQRAFNLKYGKVKDEAIKAFRDDTAKHWKEKTYPTKFGDESWKTFIFPDGLRTFRTHAELGYDVMYHVLRCQILALAMAEYDRKRGKKSKARVIGFGKGSITVYSDSKPRIVGSVEEALKE